MTIKQSLWSIEAIIMDEFYKAYHAFTDVYSLCGLAKHFGTKIREDSQSM
jgi:hypothetical protein